MGSSIFSAMNWLKFLSTNRASFPSMPYTESKKGENVSIYCGSAYHAYPYFDSPNEPGSYP